MFHSEFWNFLCMKTGKKTGTGHVFVFFQANKRKRTSRSRPSKKNKTADENLTPLNAVSTETKTKLALFPSDEVNAALTILCDFARADIIVVSET
jgi:hypothetical protein